MRRAQHSGENVTIDNPQINAWYRAARPRTLTATYAPLGLAAAIALDQGVGARQQKLAVDSGQWLLYRFDPRRAERGENPLQLDSGAAKTKVQDYLLSENRFKMLTKSRPDEAKQLFAHAQADADRRFKFYQFMQTRDLKSAIAEAADPKLQATVDQQP